MGEPLYSAYSMNFVHTVYTVFNSMNEVHPAKKCLCKIVPMQYELRSYCKIKLGEPLYSECRSHCIKIASWH